MKKHGGLLALVILVACSASGPSREDAPVKTPPVVTTLHDHVGEEVTVVGRTSKLVQAHLMEVVPGKRVEYVDVPGWGQVLVYVKDPLPEGVDLELTGTVKRVGGGPEGSKARDFVEYQLDVARWRRRA